MELIEPTFSKRITDKSLPVGIGGFQVQLPVPEPVLGCFQPYPEKEKSCKYLSCRICRFVAACRLRTWRRGGVMNLILRNVL